MATNTSMEAADMKDLNKMLVDYIDRNCLIDSKMRDLKEALRVANIKIESSEVKYEAQIDEINKLLCDSNNENSNLQTRIRNLEDERDELRAQLRDLRRVNNEQQVKIELLNADLSRSVAECDILKRKVSNLEAELTNFNDIQDQLQQCKSCLRDKTAQLTAEKNRTSQLETQLENLNADIKEYKVEQEKKITEMKEYWNTEIDNCKKTIRQEVEKDYKAKLVLNENKYQTEIDILKNENAKYVANIENLNATIEMMTKELQDLKNSRLSLNLEIAIYRELLEGVQNRQETCSRLNTLVQKMC